MLTFEATPYTAALKQLSNQAREKIHVILFWVNRQNCYEFETKLFNIFPLETKFFARLN